MKKIILSIIAFIGFAVVCNVLLTSCGGGDDDEGSSENSSGEEISPRTYSMNLTVEASGYHDHIKLSDLKTDIVSAVSSENWVTVFRNIYIDGCHGVIVEVSENISIESRTCDVTVTASDGNKVIIKITQKGRPLPNKIDEYTDQSALTKRLN